jgi:iron complex transport system permease protein
MFKNTYNYRNKIILLSAIQVLLLLAVLVWSVITGQYPLTLKGLLSGDTMSIMVFKRLRLPRALMGVIGGFGLSISGYIYQLIFKNPLASPDIVGVSSGASAGAALAIVAVSASVPVISISAFIGAVTALIITLLTAYLVPGRNSYTIVLAGIAIHSVAQTILMFLKLAADPEKQLASIEYWIMGSLNGISRDSLAIPFLTTLTGFIVIALLYRQVLILSTSEEEAVSLGVNVTSLRFIILMLATLIVSSIICVTGLISFIGLIAPHIARLLTKRNDIFTYITSGLTGAILLTLADILARSVSSSELPVSIFTSLLGAPLLIILLIRANKKEAL